MIHKVYVFHWITLVLGLIFLVISIYTLRRGIKRDKIIAVSIFLLCLLGFTWTVLRINNYNTKAEVFYGVHELRHYNNSEEYKIEILSDNTYRIFDDTETILNGEWELSVSENNVKMLVLEGGVLGVWEFDIK